MPIVDVIRAELGKTLTLQLDNGVNEKGESLQVNKSFSNIRQRATDIDLLNSANILGSLQDKQLIGVVVIEKSTLLA